MHGATIKIISSKLILQGFNISSYLWLKTQICKIAVCTKMSEIRYTAQYLRLLTQGAAAVKVWVTRLIHRGVSSDHYLNSST